MSPRREMALVWVAAFAYTAYVLVVIVAGQAIGGWLGGVVGGVFAIGPLIAGSIWAAGR